METPEANSPDEADILRHAPRESEWEPAVAGDPDLAEARDRHIERYFGPIAHVWHEIASDQVHLDVNVVEPSASRPHFTLITSGMSDRPMTVPAGSGASPYAELMLCLPADWPMTAPALDTTDDYWPIRTLKMAARLPHEYGTWLGEWHSIPNGDPAEPYAPDSPFVGILVAPMIQCSPEARTIVTGTGKRVSLMALVPLHAAEMDLKVTQGTRALLEAFEHVDVSELFDAARPSSV